MPPSYAFLTDPIPDWAVGTADEWRTEAVPITDPETSAYLGTVWRKHMFVRPQTVTTSNTTTTNTTTISSFRNFYINSDWNEWRDSSWRDSGYRRDPVYQQWPTQYAGTTAWSIAPSRTPEEAAKEARRAARAKGRATRLLREHLTDAEHDQLQASGYFEVTSLTTGHVYRVYRGHSRNVVRLDEAGVPVERLCAHGASSARMPDEDHMLAQKLYLQTLEADFRRTANISRIGRVEAESLLGLTARQDEVSRMVRDVERGMTLPLAA